MGYNTRLEGSIKIIPPLSAAELREHPEVSNSDSRSVAVPVVKQRKDTDEGYTVVLEGREITPTTDEEHKAYGLIDELCDYANFYPGHEYSGYIYCYGEESGDIWRVSIKDGKVLEERPKIVWPDGTEQEA